MSLGVKMFLISPRPAGPLPPPNAPPYSTHVEFWDALEAAWATVDDTGRAARAQVAKAVGTDSLRTAMKALLPYFARMIDALEPALLACPEHTFFKRVCAMEDLVNRLAPPTWIGGKAFDSPYMGFVVAAGREVYVAFLENVEVFRGLADLDLWEWQIFTMSDRVAIKRGEAAGQPARPGAASGP